MGGDMKIIRTNSNTALLPFCVLMFLPFFENSVSAQKNIWTSDQSGKWESRSTNRPPVSYAGKERVAVVGEPVDFYGQGASPEQTIVEYSWDFESDGLIDFVSSKTAFTTHTFTN